jgi:hypothetical protein
MKERLAERLLVEVMKWEPEDVALERPLLQALAAFKYDEYQQYSPGMRFIESLARWLGQLKTIDERKQTYQYVRQQLFFVSNRQIEHFVSIAFRDIIRPFILNKAAETLGVPEYKTSFIMQSLEYKALLRQSLFLGLSDGGHVDLYRRSEPSISQEQIWLTYDVSLTKAEDLQSNLASDLEKLYGKEKRPSNPKFKLIFLLDDFAGSGISYLRKESGHFKGKIHKTLDSVFNRSLKDIVDTNDINVCILLLLATKESLERLGHLIQEWKKEKNVTGSFTIEAIQLIPESSKIDPTEYPEMVEISKKYFDDSIIDVHYKKGKCMNPYLGFNECGLPLILGHNTPNNSLPLLWFEESRKYVGLFPRVSRHREHREY